MIGKRFEDQTVQRSKLLVGYKIIEASLNKIISEQNGYFSYMSVRTIISRICLTTVELSIQF
ncbi:MAG: hypothetical protein ACTS4X_02215 [Candidatus Hodgkinia cicadicola]